MTSADRIVYLHLGIGMPTQIAPAQTDWDPNTPFAEFMWRYSWAYTVGVRDNGSDADMYNIHEGQVVRADITQKRRIRENMSMWAFAHAFMPGVVLPTATGFTGRVLIQLP